MRQQVDPGKQTSGRRGAVAEALAGLEIVNQVLTGADGELYLAGGNHSILAYATGQMTIDPASDRTLAENLKERTWKAGRMGTPYMHLIAPEKYKVYPDQFPLKNATSMVDQFSRSKDYITYPMEQLRAVKAHRTYPLTDSHWAPHGLALIAALIGERSGMTAEQVAQRNAEIMAAIADDGTIFYGDLGRKLDPQQGEPNLRLTPKHQYIVSENGITHRTDKGGVTVNDGRMIVIDSSHPSVKKKLLIFGDSYLHNALPYLSYYFKTVIFCRTRFFHDEIAFSARADMIVTQMAERYLSAVHSDRIAPPFFMIPFLLGRTHETTPEQAQRISLALSRTGAVNFDVYKT